MNQQNQTYLTPPSRHISVRVENGSRPPCLRADPSDILLLISAYVSRNLAAPLGQPLLSCGSGASLIRLVQDTITLLANVGYISKCLKRARFCFLQSPQSGFHGSGYVEAISCSLINSTRVLHTLCNPRAAFKTPIWLFQNRFTFMS